MQKHVSLNLIAVSCKTPFLRYQSDLLPESILPGSYLLFVDSLEPLYVSDVDREKNILEVYATDASVRHQVGEFALANLILSEHKLCEPGQSILVVAGVAQLGAFIFAARAMRKLCNAQRSLFVLHSENEFPFKPVPSRFIVPSVPSHVIAAMPMLEDWGLPTRLVSDGLVPGVFDGSVDQFCAYYLNRIGDDKTSELCLLRF